MEDDYIPHTEAEMELRRRAMARYVELMKERVREEFRNRSSLEMELLLICAGSYGRFIASLGIDEMAIARQAAREFGIEYLMRERPLRDF